VNATLLRWTRGAVLGVFALAGTANAFVIDTDGHGHDLHWNHFPVSYNLVAGNVPHGAEGEQAVHAAFQTWEDASSAMHYEYAGYVGQGAQANDGHNIVYWVYGGWPYDPSLAAVTFRYFDLTDGSIIDADILFDGDNYDWSIGGDDFDIQNSATHEIGHFGGLGHSLDPSATMYATTIARETSKRILSGDDIAGLDALYGGVILSSTSNRQVVGTSSSGANGGGGGCSLSRTPGASAGPGELGTVIFVLAYLALRRRPARRRS